MSVVGSYPSICSLNGIDKNFIFPNVGIIRVVVMEMSHRKTPGMYKGRGKVALGPYQPLAARPENVFVHFECREKKTSKTC